MSLPVNSGRKDIPSDDGPQPGHQRSPQRAGNDQRHQSVSPGYRRIPGPDETGCAAGSYGKYLPMLMVLPQQVPLSPVKFDRQFQTRRWPKGS
jgi:hypothetical protein